MNYTEKYHLPQWEETDRIMRTDFNQMCADMEAGLAGNAQAAEEAAKLPYVTGFYVGTGELNRHFVLGFRPSYIIISGLVEGETTSTGANFFFGASGGQITTGQLRIMEDGFTVNARIGTPDLNKRNQAYDYIAFR